MSDPRKESSPDLVARTEAALLRREADHHARQLADLAGEMSQTRLAISELRSDLRALRPSCAYDGDHQCALRDRVVVLETSGRAYYRVAAVVMGSGGIAGLVGLFVALRGGL